MFYIEKTGDLFAIRNMKGRLIADPLTEEELKELVDTINVTFLMLKEIK
jgi:hypothetical protein